MKAINETKIDGALITWRNRYDELCVVAFRRPESEGEYGYRWWTPQSYIRYYIKRAVWYLTFGPSRQRKAAQRFHKIFN